MVLQGSNRAAKVPCGTVSSHSSTMKRERRTALVVSRPQQTDRQATAAQPPRKGAEKQQAGGPPARPCSDEAACGPSAQRPARRLLAGSNNIVPAPCSSVNKKRSTAQAASAAVAALPQVQETQASELVAAAVPAVPRGPAPTTELHKPAGLVLSSAWILSTAVHLSGAAITPLWLPVSVGGALGALYAALNRHAVRYHWRAPPGPLCVVITGGSRGLGKALAREFLRSGDRVLITARGKEGVQKAMAQLREEVGPSADITGIDCDVSSARDVERLAAVAQSRLGRVDMWINNAGFSGSFKSFVDQPAEVVEQVVRTNLVGSLLCSRAALRLMRKQPGGGHLFNLDGAGGDGVATPQYLAYGSSKAALRQAFATLKQEARLLGPHPVAVHSLSPGMVLTELLLEGATLANKQVFNILCEHPETVASYLVPRARTVVARGVSGADIRYLTLGRALLRFLTAPLRIRRFFDAAGEVLYPPERERLLGSSRRATERRAWRAARRSQLLGISYSASIAVSFLLLAMAGSHHA